MTPPFSQEDGGVFASAPPSTPGFRGVY
jgi:hypothetical protein